MSNKAINYVDEHAGAEMASGMFFVLVRLADRGSDHSGEDWTCFPSVEDIQKQTHLSRSACERHLQGLVAEGWISRKRRVRPDGKLGIFDYWIHRSADRRAALKAARAGIVAAGEKPSETLADLDHPAAAPYGEMQHGPCGDLGEAMPQFGGQPCGKSPLLEPSLEPKGNPHKPGAREPGDQGFDELAEIWPDSGAKRTNWGQARAAFAWACTLETPVRLIAAARSCAGDPDVARGDFGWPGLQTWLSEERWRSWLPKPPADPARSLRTSFAGPAEVFDQLVGLAADAAGCLAGAGWRAADRTILTPSDWAATELERRVGPHRLRGLNIRIERASAE